MLFRLKRVCMCDALKAHLSSQTYAHMYARTQTHIHADRFVQCCMCSTRIITDLIIHATVINIIKLCPDLITVCVTLHGLQLQSVYALTSTPALGGGGNHTRRFIIDTHPHRRQSMVRVFAAVYQCFLQDISKPIQLGSPN